MPAEGTAQPDAMPFLKHTFEAMECYEEGAAFLAPTNVIAAGNSFTLKLELRFEGLLVPLLVAPGTEFYVTHHAHCVETNATVVLPISPPMPGPGVGYVVGHNHPGATAADPHHIFVTSGPYTTIPGGNLPIPPGFATGTYRITTHVHAVNAAIRPLISAVYDGLVIEVV